MYFDPTLPDFTLPEFKSVGIFSGIHAKLEDIKTGKEKKYTAQVLRNRYTLPGNVFLSPNNFIFTHDRFASVKSILTENLHLVGFGDEFAKFVKLEPECDIFNLRKNPFMSMSQIDLTTEIILVPIKDFMDFLDSAYVEGTKVVWCFHTTRCGSTLWSQIFASLPEWVAFTEPTAMFYSIVRARNILDVSAFAETKEYEEMVVATIKMHILMAPKDHSIFWKTAGIDEHMIPVIRRRFPSHYVLFAYRDCLPSANSSYKAFGHMPYLLNTLVHANRELLKGETDLSDSGRTGWLLHTNGYALQLCLRILKLYRPRPNGFEWFVLRWAAKIHQMRRFQTDGVHFKPLYFDDLIQDPVPTISDLFKYVGVSLDLVGEAHKAMSQDSQAGMSFSHEKRVNRKSWHRTPDSDSRCNDLLKAFVLPDLDSKVPRFSIQQ